MYIRFFVKAGSLKDAKELVNESFGDIENIIMYKKRKSTKPYWKIDGIYIVEFSLKLYKGTWIEFLKNYSDVWEECGVLVEEFLAAEKIPDCKYMKEGFVFINIFLEEDCIDEIMSTGIIKDHEYTKGRDTFINVF